MKGFLKFRLSGQKLPRNALKCNKECRKQPLRGNHNPKKAKNMKLEIYRIKTFADAVVGKLYANKEFICHTLEPTLRHKGVKVKGKTAIPAGWYTVKWCYSPKFRRATPLVENVPGFEGIRIHRGNTAKDTQGCILLGDCTFTDKPQLYNSTPRTQMVDERVKGAAQRGEAIYLEIFNPDEP